MPDFDRDFPPPLITINGAGICRGWPSFEALHEEVEEELLDASCYGCVAAVPHPPHLPGSGRSRLG